MTLFCEKCAGSGWLYKTNGYGGTFTTRCECSTSHAVCSDPPCRYCTDATDGVAAGILGMDAAAAAKAEWVSAALGVVRRAPAGSTFTADALPDGGGKAAGAVFRHAAHLGLVAKTGRYLPSTRKSNHARPQAEWVRTDKTEPNTEAIR